MKEKVLAELEKSKFHEYLKGMKLDEIVGEAANSCCCPIANYLVSKFPDYSFGIDIDRVSIARYSEEHYLPLEPVTKNPPEWMSAFVSKLDDLCYGSVTSAEALEILETLG